MKLEISGIAKNKAENAIIITGSARAGTTIMGKVIHSLKNVEYIFEPPMMFTMVPMIENLPKEQWCLLYETYLYEEFFINAISGRSINTNKFDDSSIYNAKSIDDINQRLSCSHRKREAERRGKKKIIAYKMPDIIPYLSKITEYYSGTKIIIMYRDAVGTINSLMGKGWFSDNGENKKDTIWPWKLYRDKAVPFWVKNCDNERWIKMSEIDRCAYYYIRMNEGSNSIRNGMAVCYDRLLENPLGTIAELAAELKLTFGERTKEVVGQIRQTRKNRDLKIIDKITPDLREKAVYFSRLSKKDELI